MIEFFKHALFMKYKTLQHTFKSVIIAAVSSKFSGEKIAENM